MKRFNQLNKATVISLIVVVIICLGSLQNAQAQECSTRCIRNNTGIGAQVLSANTTGDFNTAAGAGALLRNTTGLNNTATGANALTTTQPVSTTRPPVLLHSILTPLAPTTRPAVFRRFLATERATLTPQSALGRSTSTSQTIIRPRGPRRSDTTQLVTTTQRTARTRFLQTRLTQQGYRNSDLWLRMSKRVNPDLVVRDKDGKPYSVRYEAVNAMLLNEFLKEHKTVQELKSIVVKQEAVAAQQQKQIEALTAGLQ